MVKILVRMIEETTCNSCLLYRNEFNLYIPHV